jgi:hypothetical protein
MACSSVSLSEKAVDLVAERCVPSRSRSHLLKRFNMLFYHAASYASFRSPQAPLLPLHGNRLAEAAANNFYQIKLVENNRMSADYFIG